MDEARRSTQAPIPACGWLGALSWRRFPRRQRKGFLPLCPEFVVEVMSPSDRLKRAKAKMEQWIANGALLGWLIDGDEETVYVYRKRHPMKVHRGLTELAGEGPAQGFVLELGAIWKGLE